MKKFEVKGKHSTDNKIRIIETESIDEVYKQLATDFFHIREVVEDVKNLKIHNQLDYPDVYLGFSRKYTIATDGCLLTCGTYLYNFFNKTNIEPPEFNEMMKKAGGFVANYDGDKCWINSYVMAKVIGIKYLGREHNLNQYPELNGIETPTIKEVDYSYREGHQQHFVIRIHDKNGNYILDTLGGVRRAINYYEIKMSPDYEGWGGHKKYFSYRKFVKN